MPNLGRNTFQVGGVVFPLTTTSGHDLIVDADPLIFNLLQFFKSVITTYMGARFAIDATAADLKDAANVLITSPVKQLVPYSPAEYLQEVQYKFPLLSAARVDETYKETTRIWFTESMKLEVLYMLPPLRPEQAYKLDMYRSLVTKILIDRLELGYDPSYNNGELVFQTAGIEEIKFVRSDYIGLEKPATNTFFPSVMMTFDVKERKNQVAGSFPDLSNISGEIDISDGYQPNNYDMIDYSLDL